MTFAIGFLLSKEEAKKRGLAEGVGDFRPRFLSSISVLETKRGPEPAGITLGSPRRPSQKV